MDGFEVRLQLVSILKKLSSSQNSIQSTIRFLLKHKDKYGEDLWDCLVEEAEKVNLNARINILYLIDGLLFTSSTALLTSHQEYQHSRRTNLPSSSTIISTSFNYGDLIKKDIIKLIEIVVPTSFNKKGLLNLMSTVQVIKNWKSQISIIDHFLTLDLLEQIDQILNHRKQILGKMEVNDTQVGIEDNELLDFTKKEILDRIDDDRERHKRLRERIWVLPIPSMSSLSPKLTNIQHHQRLSNSERPSSSIPSGGPTGGPHIELDLTISLECDQLINANLEDTGSAGLEDHDWNAIHFDNHRCFGLASNHHRLLDQFVDF
ncbi:hypothetical protein KEM48_001111 [Puccinia striiformis f. sp. tritici PST-130]|nr:hypothetical protein KEM48_001111 [Puccinia striiformis f. sp. tritici PST-130]